MDFVSRSERTSHGLRPADAGVPTSRIRARWAATLLLWGIPAIVYSDTSGEREAYAATGPEAIRGGHLVVHGDASDVLMQPMVQDFQAAVPGARVEYRQIDALSMHRQFLGEVRRGTVSADVLWSSAMDLQMKLVNDMHAARLEAADSRGLPAAAAWRSEAFATTCEPVGFAFDKRRLRESDVPRTRASLLHWLQREAPALKGRVGSLDIERNALGFLLATQDSAMSADHWRVVQALGQLNPRLAPGSEPLMDDLITGRISFAYNVLESCVSARRDTHPMLGFIRPSDYCLVASRVAFVHRHTRHTALARAWIHHLRSRRGQELLSTRVPGITIRTDVSGSLAPSILRRDHGLHPIEMGPGLMTYRDQHKREAFMERWRSAMA